MAIVRFSNELQSAILNKASQTFVPRITAATNNIPMSAEELYDRIFSRYLPHMGMLPPEFFNSTSMFGIHSVHEVLLNHNFNLTTPKLFPYKLGPQPHFKATFDFGTGGTSYKLIPDGTGIWDDLVEMVQTRNNNIKAIEDQLNKFKDNLRVIMTTHSTLAPALKAWPPLWDFVPDSYKDKHREIKERKKNDSVNLSEVMDLDSMTSVVVASKFLGK